MTRRAAPPKKPRKNPPLNSPMPLRGAAEDLAEDLESLPLALLGVADAPTLRSFRSELRRTIPEAEALLTRLRALAARAEATTTLEPAEAREEEPAHDYD